MLVSYVFWELPEEDTSSLVSMLMRWALVRHCSPRQMLKAGRVRMCCFRCRVQFGSCVISDHSTREALGGMRTANTHCGLIYSKLNGPSPEKYVRVEETLLNAFDNY